MGINFHKVFASPADKARYYENTADLLQQRALSPPPQRPQGRIAANTGLADGMTTLMQALVTKRSRAQAEKARNEQKKPLYAAILGGQPTSEFQIDDPAGGEPTSYSIPRAMTPENKGIMELIKGASGPQLDAIQNQLLQQQISPQHAVLSAGAKMIDPRTGREIASNPATETGANSRYGSPQVTQSNRYVTLDRSSGRYMYADSGEPWDSRADPASANIKLQEMPDGSVIAVDVRRGIGGGPRTESVVDRDTAISGAAQRKGAEAEAVAEVVPADTRQTAQAKYPRVEAAQRRLDRVANASKALDDNMLSGGPMQGRVVGLSEEGSELNAANAQLLSELTALTRTPGLGSQSDFEQRLQQLVLPSADMYPAVRRRQVEELQSFMRDLDGELRKIGSGQSSQGGHLDVSRMSDDELRRLVNGE